MIFTNLVLATTMLFCSGVQESTQYTKGKKMIHGALQHYGISEEMLVAEYEDVIYVRPEKFILKDTEYLMMPRKRGPYKYKNAEGDELCLFYSVQEDKRKNLVEGELMRLTCSSAVVYNSVEEFVEDVRISKENGYILIETLGSAAIIKNNVRIRIALYPKDKRTWDIAEIAKALLEAGLVK